MIKECEYIIYKKMQMTNIPMKMEAAMQNFFTKKFKSWNTSEVGDGMKKTRTSYTVDQSIRLFNILKAICCMCNMCIALDLATLLLRTLGLQQ